MAVPIPAPPRPDHDPNGVVPAEWPAQAADAIVDAVGKVRDKTTRPAIVAARSAVYGLLAAIVGLVALVLFLIGLVRLLEHLPGHIWTVYAVIGVVLTVAGTLVLRKANRPVTAAT